MRARQILDVNNGHLSIAIPCVFWKLIHHVHCAVLVCCFLLGRKSHIAAWLTNMPHCSYQAWFNMEWYIPLFRTSIASAFSTNMTLLILKACRKAFSSSLTLKLLLYTCNHQKAVFQSLRPKGGCQKHFYEIRPQRERGDTLLFCKPKNYKYPHRCFWDDVCNEKYLLLSRGLYSSLYWYIHIDKILQF